MAGEIQMTGDVTASVLVSVDSLAGLVDGLSLACFERRSAGEGPDLRIEAAWNEGIDGFTVRGLLDGKALDEPVDVPGDHEVLLQFIDSGDTIVLLVVPERLGQVLGEHVQDGSSETAVFALGAAGLGKGAAFWFADLTLVVGGNFSSGPVETEAAARLAVALFSLDAANELLDPPPPHLVGGIYNDVVAALIQVEAAVMVLGAAVEAGTFLPTTDGQKAYDKALHAYGIVSPAVDTLNDIVFFNPSDDATQVKKPLLTARKDVELALALLAGFKSKSHKKLLNSVEVDVD
jgi:hypothetical protein